MTAPLAETTATRKRSGRPIVDPTRFPCGHLRSPENSGTRKYAECQTCHRQRAAIRRQRRQPAIVVPAHSGQKARRYITTPAIQRAIAESRAAYLRAIGQSPDSTDTAQRRLALGGEQ